MLDTLIFVNNLEKYDNDIVRYSKVMIEEGRIAELSRELQEIHSVGPKIASMWIRDLVTIYGLEKILESKQESWSHMFPVDTWVKQFYKFFKGMKGDNDETRINTQELVTDLVDQCISQSLNSMKVNQGIWYSSKRPWVVISECYQMNNLKSP